MGRKKSNRPVRTRQLPTIPRIFDCPRCEATAIRISVQQDIALVECGNCLLKQTVTNLKSIEEPVDIFGSFVDEYYNNIELHEMPTMDTSSGIEDQAETSLDSEELVEQDLTEESVEVEAGEEQAEESEEIQEEPKTVGFVPRAKGDVLKKKHKDKDNKKKKVNLSSFGGS